MLPRTCSTSSPPGACAAAAAVSPVRAITTLIRCFISRTLSIHRILSERDALTPGCGGRTLRPFMRTSARGAVLLAGLLVLGATLTGQNAGTPSGPGVDLAGYWSAVFHQDAGLATGGGMVGDYGGIPLNEAGRIYALSWDASRMTVRQ